MSLPTGLESQFENQYINVYHMFLRYLYLNLRESNSANLNSTANNMTSNQNAANATNLVWRQFKGRLYTRLHDKRIAELDLNGIVNVAYLFFVLIKCFSSSNSLTAISLKQEQLESYYRILNVFVKSKNLQKIDQILPIFSSFNSASSNSTSNMISNRMNAITGIFNTKFVALKLWFDGNETTSNETLNISEEIDAFLQQEFINVVNGWLKESVLLVNLSSVDLKENHQPQGNQISNFKNSHALSQFLSEFLSNYLENCKSVLIQQTTDQNQASFCCTYQLAIVSCRLLSKYFILFIFYFIF